MEGEETGGVPGQSGGDGVRAPPIWEFCRKLPNTDIFRPNSVLFSAWKITENTMQYFVSKMFLKTEYRALGGTKSQTLVK